MRRSCAVDFRLLLSLYAIFPLLIACVGLPQSDVKKTQLRCELRNCDCLSRLKREIDSLALELSVAGKVSGSELVLKLSELKNRYSSAFSLHQVATAMLSWLVKPPKCVFVTDPFNGERTIFSGEGITIIGAAEMTAEVRVNGIKVPTDTKNRFAIVAPLKLGTNTLTLTVTKGTASKQWQIKVVVEHDRNLEKLKELCERAKTLNVNVGEACKVLEMLNEARLSGKYTKAHHKQASELISEVWKRILLAQLSKTVVATSSQHAQLRKLWEMARNFIAVGDLGGAERALNWLESFLQAQPNDVPCEIEPILSNGKWCYRFTNMHVSAIVSQLGGRLTQLYAFSIPTLASGYGLYEKADGEELGKRDWVLIVEHASSEAIILSAHTSLNGKVSLVRRIRLLKGSPNLFIDYSILNNASEDANCKLCISFRPAIGYGKTPQLWDRLVVATGERLPISFISPDMRQSKPKRFELNLTNGFVGAYDSAYSTGVGITFDKEVLDANLILGAGTQYSYELSIKRALSKLQPKGKIEFSLALVSAFACESKEAFYKALMAASDTIKKPVYKTLPFIGRPSEKD